MVKAATHQAPPNVPAPSPKNRRGGANAGGAGGRSAGGRGGGAAPAWLFDARADALAVPPPEDGAAAARERASGLGEDARMTSGDFVDAAGDFLNSLDTSADPGANPLSAEAPPPTVQDAERDAAGADPEEGAAEATEAANPPSAADLASIRASTAPRRGPRHAASRFRGVTYYRKTDRWDAHIWHGGKQVYLGGWADEKEAAAAYDQACLKFRGTAAELNFDAGNYRQTLETGSKLSEDDFVKALRRRSQGFSRGQSRFRGITRHKCGRWEVRMGQFMGKKYKYIGLYDTQEEAAKAYDSAAVKWAGPRAVTNFPAHEYGDELRQWSSGPDRSAASEAAVKKVCAQVDSSLPTARPLVRASRAQPLRRRAHC